MEYLYLLFIVLMFGVFTPIYVIFEETIRYFYRCKSQELPMGIKSWWRYIRNLYWYKSTLWRAPIAIFGNGLIVLVISLYMAIFATTFFQFLCGENLVRQFLFILVISGWSWHVIIPSIYTRFVRDRSNRFALLFKNRETV